MGLLFADTTSGGGDFKTKAESEWLQGMGCKACPLNVTPGKIDATGVARPDVYILGEAPGKTEEEERRQFVGKAGELLRDLMPEGLEREVRWNNTINCHPPKNRDPLPQEINCCRPRVIKDIEAARPTQIWGFGNVPLQWVSGFSGVQNWRGRRMPVKIGNHTCWYYVFTHPSFLARVARNNGKEFGSEDERMAWLDMRRAIADLEYDDTPVVHSPQMARAGVECITDINQIMKALQWASREPHVGWDWETNRKRPYEEGAKILSAAVGTLDKTYAFPVEHPGSGYSKKQIAEVKELIRRFFISAPCVKRAHNLAFELEWAGWNFGQEVVRAQPWIDTANLAVVLDERKGGKMKSGPLSLEFLVQQYYGFNIKKLSNVNRERLEFTPLPTVLLYNGMDAKYHDGLGDELEAIIEREGLQLASRLAQRRVPTVVLSQLKGVPVDQATVIDLQKKYGDKVEDALAVIRSLQVVKRFERIKGREFNPQSSKDLPYVFDEMLRCEEVWVQDGWKKEEKLSTDETVLDAIIENHGKDSDAGKLANAVKELREASGTKSKYVDALRLGDEDSVIFPDGLMHTNFNTFFAETGRLSSDSPNLQNFPKRDADTKEVRKSVRAAPGDIIMSFDYGQIEARVIAMFTKDPVFVKALWERFDVHQEWAERLAYAYPSRVGGKKVLADFKAKTKDGLKAMKDFRTDIKNQWTFPLFFGARDESVAGYLKMPENIIKQQVREFWKMFPETKDWQDETIRFYEDHGYVECLTGRRRRGPLTKNQIINTPVQGTAAEIVLDAMSRLSEKKDPEIQPELNIHDDLTFIRVNKRRMDIVAEKVIDAMLSVPFEWVNVPIVVEMSVGPNWCDLEELKNEKKETISVYASDTWDFGK
jgi:DNA polymerase-1